MRVRVHMHVHVRVRIRVRVRVRVRELKIWGEIVIVSLCIYKVFLLPLVNIHQKFPNCCSVASVVRHFENRGTL